MGASRQIKAAKKREEEAQKFGKSTIDKQFVLHVEQLSRKRTVDAIVVFLQRRLRWRKFFRSLEETIAAKRIQRQQALLLDVLQQGGIDVSKLEEFVQVYDVVQRSQFTADDIRNMTVIQAAHFSTEDVKKIVNVISSQDVGNLTSTLEHLRHTTGNKKGQLFSPYHVKKMVGLLNETRESALLNRRSEVKCSRID